MVNPYYTEPDVASTELTVDQWVEPEVVVPEQGITPNTANVIAAQVAVINGDIDLNNLDFTDVDDQYKALYKQITETGTRDIKQSLADEDTSKLMSIYDMEARRAIETGQDVPNSLQLAMDYQIQEADSKRETIIEEAFSDKMLEMLASDPSNANMIEDIIDYENKGASLDRILNINKRTMMVERMFEETIAEKDKQGMFMKSFEFVSSLIPLREWYQLFDLEPDEKFMQGDKARVLNNKIYDLPEEDLGLFLEDFYGKLKDSSALFDINEAQMLDTLRTITRVSDAQVEGSNFIGFVDAADSALIVGSIGKGFISKASMLTQFGQRKLATRSIIKTLEEAGDRPSLFTETTKDIASESAIPSGARIVEPLSNGEVSNTLGVIVESNSTRASAIIDNIARDERILDSDRLEAVKNATNNLIDEYGASTIADTRIIKTDRGVQSVSIAIGDKTGAGFTSKEVAEATILNRQLPPDSSVFQSKDGKFFIRVNKDVNESFIIDKNLTEAPFNPLSRLLKSPASMLPKWLQARAENAGSLKGMYAREMQPIIKTITTLKKQPYKELVKVVLEGNIKSVWFGKKAAFNNKGEMVSESFDTVFSRLNNNKLPTKEQHDAYRAFINLNDIDYAFRNWDLFVDKFSRGYGTANVKLANLRIGRADLKEVENVKDVAKLAVYDNDTGKVFSGAAKGSDFLKDKLKNGYQLFNLSSQYKLADKSGFANAILIKKGHIKVGTLQMKQLPYRSGGHRGPEGTYFVKQAQVGSFSDGGGKYILNPLTHAVGRTRSALEDYTQRMNNALEAYSTAINDGSSAAIRAADDIIRKSGIEDGFEEFSGLVKNGSIDAKHRFRIVENNENPVPIGGFDEAVDLRQANSFTSFIETQGRPYYGRKGSSPLRGPDDEVAKLIDPIQLMERSLSDSVHKGNLANYRSVASDAWVNTYGGILRPQSGMSKRQTFFSRKSLSSADFDSNAKKSFVRAAINQHSVMQTQLSSYNEYGRWIAGGMTRLADFIDKKGGSNLAGKLLDIRSSDPIVAMRSLAYNVHLGLFQIDQLFVQAQTAISIAALDPLNAVKLMNRGLHFQALNYNTSEEALNMMAKAFKDPEDFKEFVKIGRERGVIELYGDMSMLDHNAIFNIGGPLSPKNIAEKGRSFIMAAERYNKAVGYSKAWDELRKVNSLKAMRNNDVQMELTSLASKYSMNMSSMSSARWQKGIFGVPTQFLSYPIRFLENMTSKRLGGSAQWTGSEKIRLGLTQAVLYGSAGIPFLPGEAVPTMLEAMGVDPKENEDAFLIARGGAIDWALKNWLGIDSSLSNRVGLGKGYRDLWDKLNGEDIESSSFFNVIGGPSGALLVDAASSSVSAAIEAPAILMESIRAERSDLFTDFAMDQVTNFAVEHISSANDVYKAYWAFKTGEYISAKTGRVLVEGLSNAEALGFMLGLTPNKMLEAVRMSNSIKKDRQVIQGASGVVSRLRNEEVRALREYWDTGSKDSYEDMLRIMNMKNMALGSIDEDIRERVRKASDSKAYESFYKLTEEKFLSRFTKLDDQGVIKVEER